MSFVWPGGQIDSTSFSEPPKACARRSCASSTRLSMPLALRRANARHIDRVKNAEIGNRAKKPHTRRRAARRLSLG